MKSLIPPQNLAYQGGADIEIDRGRGVEIRGRGGGGGAGRDSAVGGVILLSV